jgi:hypothetical protein
MFTIAVCLVLIVGAVLTLVIVGSHRIRGDHN